MTSSKPIFQVNAALSSSEVVLKPSANEIYTIIMRDVKDLMERVKVFTRWMVRTCLECKPIKTEAATDFVTFSFFEDVMTIQVCVKLKKYISVEFYMLPIFQVINDLIYSVQDMSHRLAHDCWRYLYKWKQYSNLWSSDKMLMCEKFATSNPTLQQYDEKFSFYDSIIEEIDEMTDYYDVSSIR